MGRLLFPVIYVVLGLLVIGISIALAVIVDQKFWDYATAYYGYYSRIVIRNECTLGKPTNDAVEDGYYYYSSSNSLCSTNWAVAAFSGFAALFVVIMAVLSLRKGAGRKGLLYIIVFSIITIIYVIGSAYNTARIPDANDVYKAFNPGDPLEGWRNAVLALTWVGFALGIVGIIVGIIDMMKNRGQPQTQPQYYYYGPPPTQEVPPPYPPMNPGPDVPPYGQNYQQAPPQSSFYPPPAGQVFTPQGPIPAPMPSGYPATKQ